MKKGWKSIWLTPLFFTTGVTVIFLLAFGFAFPVLFRLGQVLLVVLLVLTGTDLYFVFRKENQVEARRKLPHILGLGDETKVVLELFFRGPLTLSAAVYDELPFQIQMRNVRIDFDLDPGLNRVSYTFRPINRGNYAFGSLNLLLEGPIHFVRRRMVFNLSEEIPVYPSIRQMHETELMAFSRVVQSEGEKRYRRIGQSYEFEQISPFVEGDDYRNINWKATGKPRELMVNQYQD
jgi:uncharacterized protein (DUF58 family)